MSLKKFRRNKKMKKKVLCLLMAAMLCMGMMVGCGSGGDDKKDDAKQEVQDDKTDDKADASDESGSGAADGEITETITLSGSYYSGQVMITLEINPDGTVSGSANGEDLTGTWEFGDDVYIIANGTSSKGDMKFEVTKEDSGYSATVDLVAGMVLSGK